MGLSSEQIDALERIQSLKVSGAISSEEFEDLKADLLRPSRSSGLPLAKQASSGLPLAKQASSGLPLAKQASSGLPLAKQAWTPGSKIASQMDQSGQSGYYRWYCLTNRNVVDCYCRVLGALRGFGLKLNLKKTSGWDIYTKNSVRKFITPHRIQFEEVDTRSGDVASTRIVLRLIDNPGPDPLGIGLGRTQAMGGRIDECLGRGFKEQNVVGNEWLGIPILNNRNFQGFDFRDSFLRCSNFEGSDFHHVNFVNADLSYANLAGSRLIGADLTKANLTGTNVTDILWDETTIWPEGFTPTPSR